MTEKGGVQSVERIFQLIEQLASHPAGASLQRLAQETGLAKSTVCRSALRWLSGWLTARSSALVSVMALPSRVTSATLSPSTTS